MGETKRVVRIRISEHHKIQTNQNPNDPKNRKKTVYQHINSCPVFQLKLSEYITDNSTGVSPTPDPCDLKYQFHTNMYTLLASGLHGYHERTNMEALMITVMKPALNEQVAHKNVTFI